MRQNKICPAPGGKIIITAISIIGLFFVNPSFGNNGINQGTTLVLEYGQYPAALKNYSASEVYVLYWGTGFTAKDLQGSMIHEDTIINYKRFIAAFPNGTGFRLIYKSNENIDSVYQLDSKFRITHKAYILDEALMRITEFDSTMKKKDEFIYNYAQKISASTTRGKYGGGGQSLALLLRAYRIYDTYDRNHYAQNSVWILSIGIDDYGPITYNTCKTDAQSYTDFFKKQFAKGQGSTLLSSLFHEYILLDKYATRDTIIGALKDIASKAAFNDYFIFNFSGCSNLTKDSINAGTNFLPYDVVVLNAGNGSDMPIKNRNQADTASVRSKLIPLKILQEYFQTIPAVNQLFISEAGPSEKFKTEFVKTLMQNSPEIAATLNKNRVIIVPNGYGYDNVKCHDSTIKKGPINYYITSLRSDNFRQPVNIFDLFDENKASNVAFNIKNKAYTCGSFNFEYFDIFFERKFLKEYSEIFDDQRGVTRGVKVQNAEMKETLDSMVGKLYALVVGTDNYQAKGWHKLNNPISDARAVADELARSYGFEVQLLEDKPRDSIYKAIREYYAKANPKDQLVLYFAGHGDADKQLLDDGFIVCSDSKPVEEDPMRNSYIPYDKLKKILNNIPARQILVLLDVCHGGTFDAQAFAPKEGDKRVGTYNITNENVLQTLKDKLPLRTRKFLSSVGAEAAFDGQAGRHSPFANSLLQILRSKGSGSNGILRLSQIYAVLDASNDAETVTLRISPQMNDFGKVDAFTEFIFVPVYQKKDEQKQQ